MGAPSPGGGYTRSQTAWVSHLPTRHGFLRTTGFAVATPSSRGSTPARASVPTTQARREVGALLRLWAFRSASRPSTPAPERTALQGPPPGGGTARRRGGRLAKFLQVAPRARREPANLYVTFCPGPAKARSSARARAHTHICTHLHASTCTHCTSLRTENLRTPPVISWGFAVKLTFPNFFATLSEVPPLPFLSLPVPPLQPPPIGLTCGIHVGFLQ